MVVFGRIFPPLLEAPAFRLTEKVDTLIRVKRRHALLGKAEMVRAIKVPLLGFRIWFHRATLFASSIGDEFVHCRIPHSNHDDIAGAPVNVHAIHVDVHSRSRERI